ncbi:hypothetical protein [Leucobacter triazinivorans]|uniref:Uncharacterized protein n=1 Tax=Leucobacter triazinivorans TaxID=1784719 RepID=A0A4V0Z1S1_9MICO|nr:hypothetical protein [Leucobacter triazinivorans]QBE49389.1 hypothetical protein EVS81_11525 [Leucobacter triazinivorans]
MAGGKRIGASSDAGDEVRALRSYDPGAPSESEMQVVSGTDAAAGRIYRSQMQTAGLAFFADFSRHLREIQSDCEASAAMIEEMHALDDEIASALRHMEVPVDAPASSEASESSSTGGGKTSW